MKQLKNLVFKSLIFALPFLLAGKLSASVTNTLKIEPDANEKSIYLSFKGNQSINVLIQIKDENEAILHQEQVINQIDFSKKFNLKNLPEGIYFIEVEDELKEIVQPIEISASNVNVDPSNRIDSYKPVYQFKNNKLDINFLAINSEKVTVEVFDFQNLLIFDQEFENAGKSFGERLDLSKLQKGNYRIKVIAGNQTFYKTVKVK